MLMRHKTHNLNEWYDQIDYDLDCDFSDGSYIGKSNRIRLSDGKWYYESECFYLSQNGIQKPCTV